MAWTRIPTATVCYICCEPGADSREDVIPKGFFPGRLPPNPLKLPAHLSCHNHTRIDEEYFRDLMASFGRDTSASAARLWERENPDGAVWRSFLRNRRLRASFQAGMLPRVAGFAPGGVYLRDAPGIRFDENRVYPSVAKIVRGLYRHHTGRLLPPDVHFSWGALNEMPAEERPILAVADEGLSYGDVFESRYVVLRGNGLECAAWWLTFYRWTMFRCFIARSINSD